jgi:hypothetical protein
MMARKKKGDLPGRYVPPHIRKWPRRPWEYTNVAAYQEHVDPIPAETDAHPPQLEFNFRQPKTENKISPQIN